VKIFECLIILKILVPGGYWNVDVKDYYTSLSDFGVEGSFKWCFANSTVGFTPSTYNNFYPNQPDNYQNSEHCITMMHLDPGPNSYFSYNDVSCASEYNFACEVRIKK
jgi:hypothetical protein